MIIKDKSELNRKISRYRCVPKSLKICIFNSLNLDEVIKNIDVESLVYLLSRNYVQFLDSPNIVNVSDKDMMLIINHYPKLLDKSIAIFLRLSTKNKLNLLQTLPDLSKYVNWQTINDEANRLELKNLLIKQPQFIFYINFHMFTSNDVADILVDQPQLHYCVTNFKMFSNDEIEKILSYRPKLITKLDITKLVEYNITGILIHQPQLASKFNIKLLSTWGKIKLLCKQDKLLPDIDLVDVDEEMLYCVRISNYKLYEKIRGNNYD